MAPPGVAERKQFLQKLFTRISRTDPRWASALREAEVGQLANLTANCTFAEIEFVVRRAFLRSTSADGSERDPVAIHHFDQILGSMGPRALSAFQQGPPLSAASLVAAASAPEAHQAQGTEGGDKKKKNGKDPTDPMEGIVGWCNFWLPEALHLPPVVWAMIIFGILAHFMAGSMYPPHGSRRRRGGAAGSRPLFNDIGGLGDHNFGDWGGYPMGGAGNPFANFPPPPGMPRAEPAASSGGGNAGNAGGDLPTPTAPAAAASPDAKSSG
jgi:hypothetical protein